MKHFELARLAFLLLALAFLFSLGGCDLFEDEDDDYDTSSTSIDDSESDSTDSGSGSSSNDGSHCQTNAWYGNPSYIQISSACKLACVYKAGAYPPEAVPVTCERYHDLYARLNGGSNANDDCPICAPYN